MPSRKKINKLIGEIDNLFEKSINNYQFGGAGNDGSSEIGKANSELELLVKIMRIHEIRDVLEMIDKLKNNQKVINIFNKLNKDGKYNLDELFIFNLKELNFNYDFDYELFDKSLENFYKDIINNIQLQEKFKFINEFEKEITKNDELVNIIKNKINKILFNEIKNSIILKPLILIDFKDLDLDNQNILYFLWGERQENKFATLYSIIELSQSEKEIDENEEKMKEFIKYLVFDIDNYIELEGNKLSSRNQDIPKEISEDIKAELIKKIIKKARNLVEKGNTELIDNYIEQARNNYNKKKK